MIYVLVGAKGELLAWAHEQANLPTPPRASTVIGLAAWASPPPLPHVWSVTARDFVVPADAERAIPLDEFLARYTFDERVGLNAAMYDHANATVRASLRVADALLRDERAIRVSSARIQFYVNKTFDLLVSTGVVAPANKAARIAAVLSP